MGACLYELVTGRIPFPGKTPFEMFAAALARPPVPMRVYVDDVPASAQAIVTTCLRKERGERFESMRELASVLRSA
jgi:serine/threonine-protein kinase